MISTLNTIVAVILDNFLGTTIEIPGQIISYRYIYFLYAIAIFIPYLAVIVLRLHDVGKSGWWFLIAFIPLIGWVWIIVLLFSDSNPGDNLYGPNPKQVLAAEA